MKLSKTNQILLTMLYGISLIFITMLIFRGSTSSVFDNIVTYAFYIASSVSVTKAFADLISFKKIKDLAYLILVLMPLIIFLIYLMLLLD